MESYGLLSIIPPVIALALALWKKQVIPALFIGGLIGEFILSGNKAGFLFQYFERVISITGQRGNLQLIVFSLLVGSLVKLIESANGFKGLILLLESRKKEQSKRTAWLLTWGLGILMFLENWSNILITGTTVGPLYKKLGISRERLAYYIHTISINFIAIVVINSWGAFYMTLLSGQQMENPMGIVLKAMPLNFYCIISLLVVLIAMTREINLGKMKIADPRFYLNESNPENKGDSSGTRKTDALYMVIPVVVILSTLIASLLITGDGEIMKGDGTASVFYAIIASILVLAIYLLARRRSGVQAITENIFKGMGGFIQVAVLLAFALSLGNLCKELGTGVYIAGLVNRNLPVFIIPPIFFLLSCAISFATGTSYGTFSIMIPLAMPTALEVGIDPALMFAACISGGVFGDNASPFSDTTVVTSLTTRLNVIRHIETQLPYALISASLAFILFALAAIFI